MQVLNPDLSVARTAELPNSFTYQGAKNALPVRVATAFLTAETVQVGMGVA